MKRFAVGVDLGGTNLRVAAVEETGEMLEKVALPVRMLAGRDAVIEELCAAVRALGGKHRGTRVVAGVGIGVPGILYAESGTLRKSPNLPGWENFKVRDAIAARLAGDEKENIIIDNDANVAALGESWLGAGREYSSLCLLTLGTGVGGGLILDDKIWRGFLGMAGEVGHITVRENGVACGCGNTGCLETEASATAVVRMAEELLAAGKSPALAKARNAAPELTAKLVYDTAAAGDAGCRGIFESFGKYLGQALAGLVNSLNLPLYVIGGGVVAAWPLFSPAMLGELRKRSYVFAEGSTHIERAALAEDAGLYGAAYLALQGGKAAPPR